MTEHNFLLSAEVNVNKERILEYYALSNPEVKVLVKKNIRQALVTIAMILLPCLVLGYFIFYENMRIRIEDEKEKNTELAKITSQYLDTYLRGIKNRLRILGNNDEKLNKRVLQEEMKSFKISEELENIFLIDGDGRLLIQLPMEVEPVKIPDGMLREADNHGTVTYILEPNRDPVQIMMLSTITNMDGSRHYAGVVLSMAKIARDFANIKVSNHGYLIMIDRAGHVLVHPDPVRFRQLLPLNQMKKDPIYLASSRGIPGSIEIVAPLDGIKKLFSYATVKETGWIVLLVEPETDFQVFSTEHLTKYTVIFLLVLVTVLMLFLYLKSMAQKEAQQKALNSEKLALVGQMAAGLAHEIRNPLTAIKGFLQIISSEESDPEKLSYQKIMATEIERIAAIVRETLLLAKPHESKLTDFSLTAALRELEPVMAAEALSGNLALRIIMPREPLPVRGDPNYLKMAVLNVVKNALEASPPKGEVALIVENQGSEVLIRITDHGPGIPEASLNKVGTPFYTTKETGTGLGLMVTRHVVENMHGKLLLNCPKGQGTEIKIMLPLLPTKLPQETA